MKPSRTRMAAMALAMPLLVVGTHVASADWMAYAVDGAGAFGHGRAPAQDVARRIAIEWCTRPACKVIAEASERCTALAEGNGGAYSAVAGAGTSRETASEQALKACAAATSGASCRIRHWYCWQ